MKKKIEGPKENNIHLVNIWGELQGQHQLMQAEAKDNNQTHRAHEFNEWKELQVWTLNL
jgi:hypothetical protein